jgi:outer membrane protein with beta-barrel domain
MRKLILICGVLLATGVPAAAQGYNRAEFFAGYTYAHSYNTNGDSSSTNGGTVDVAFFPLKWVGIVGSVGGSATNGFTDNTGTFVAANISSIRYSAGPRIRYIAGPVSPFVQTLFGGVSRSSVVNSAGTTLSAAQTVFALSVGGGIDIKIARHFSIRPAEVSYTYTQFTALSGTTNQQNGISYSAGIVIH